MSFLRFCVLVSCSLAWLGSCGGSGSGGGESHRLTGIVRSPNGQAIGFSAAPRRTRPIGWEGREALVVPGLLAVPDGTAVELVRVSDAGVPLESLASTVTAGGQYSFDLSDLGLAQSSDLFVIAGSGASELRAPGVRAELDVDPLSEAVVQLALGSGPLSSYTTAEM